MAYAAVVNEEIRDLFAAGADVVQIDEPYMQASPEEARQYGLKALNRALEGITGMTAVHICFGYAALVHQRPSGYSFLPEFAACALVYVRPENVILAPDCGMKYLARDVAFAKLRSMATAATMLRSEFSTR